MGAYLSEPVVEKQTESANGDAGIHYGATSMQGWRINQEDAHNCILNFDDKCALFAVYDGHGGAEVSQYAAVKFPDFLKKTPAWSDGRFGQALEDAFLNFDELLTRDDVMEELKTLAGKKNENEGDEPDEDKKLLYEEAVLPLDDVLRRYGLKIDRNLLVTSGGGGNMVSSKIKIKREKRVLVSSATTEDGNGPPTPPSSPDARSAAAAANATTISIGTTEKCDSSARRDHSETLPMSPPQVDDNASTQTKLVRSALKRKSCSASDYNDAVDPESELAENKSHDSGDKKNNYEIYQSNGTGQGDGKTGVDGIVSPSEELPHVKRFKDDGMDSIKQGKMMADGSNDLDEPVDPTSGEFGEDRPLNGSHRAHSVGDNGKADVDSTDDNGPKPMAESINENHMSSGNGGNVGSPMMVEEPNSVGKAVDEKSSRVSGGKNKSSSMDESSGASEDDEDEDYNMEVEDEESSDATSESDGIEEDEVVDEQEEMGVDDDVEDEEEEDDDDDDMFAMPSGDTPGVDSGTTACVAIIRGSTIYVANAGDSRCVLCRGDKAVDLSLDHKPEDLTEKRRIESAGGKITADGRVNGGLNLSRAIGDHFYKRNSELPLRDQMITALPDVRVESLKPEDKFLVLACDGIWNSMNSQDVVDFVRVRLSKGLSPAAICEQLCDVCLAPNTIGDGTGCDNMTAIVVLLNQNSANSNPANVASSNDTNRAADGSGGGAPCT